MKVTKEKVKEIMGLYYLWNGVWEISYLTWLSRFTIDKYLTRYVSTYKAKKRLTLKEIIEQDPGRIEELKREYQQSPMNWFLHKYKTSIVFATKTFWFKKKSLQNRI